MLPFLGNHSANNPNLKKIYFNTNHEDTGKPVHVRGLIKDYFL